MPRRRPAAPPASRPLEPCKTCSQGQALGRLEGLMESVLNNQAEQGEQLKSIDSRLRTVENRSAVAGAAAGLMVALGLDLIKSKFFKV